MYIIQSDHSPVTLKFPDFLLSRAQVTINFATKVHHIFKYDFSCVRDSASLIISNHYRLDEQQLESLLYSPLPVQLYFSLTFSTMTLSLFPDWTNYWYPDFSLISTFLGKWSPWLFTSGATYHNCTLRHPFRHNPFQFHSIISCLFHPTYYHWKHCTDVSWWKNL